MLNYRLTALQRVRCPTGANRAILFQRHEHRNGRTRRTIFGSSRRTPRGFWVAELDLRVHPPVEEPHDESAERALGTVEATSELIAALGTLAPRQRAVLALRYLDDLSEIQVAEVLGCSVGNVKSTSSRAIERLREVLDVVSVRANDLGTPHTVDSQEVNQDKEGASNDEPANRG
jgi:RNA polymerase sigma factor (sigma-70 family)